VRAGWERLLALGSKLRPTSQRRDDPCLRLEEEDEAERAERLALHRYFDKLKAGHLRTAAPPPAPSTAPACST